MIDVLQRELLTPAFVDLVVEKVLTRAPITGSVDEERVRLTRELADVSGELERLVDGLAKAGTSPTLTAALKHREATKAHLEASLAALDRRHDVSQLERQRFDALARERRRNGGRCFVGTRRRPGRSWRRCWATSWCSDLKLKGCRGYRFSGEGTITTLLAGLVPELSQAVASPIYVSWNQLREWLRAVDGLRRAA